MSGGGDIHEVTETATGRHYPAMVVAVSELLEAIKSTPPHCNECYVGAVLDVPLDNPTAWEVDIWHDADCSVGAPVTTSRSREPVTTRLHVVE